MVDGPMFKPSSSVRRIIRVLDISIFRVPVPNLVGAVKIKVSSQNFKLGNNLETAIKHTRYLLQIMNY